MNQINFFIENDVENRQMGTCGSTLTIDTRILLTEQDLSVILNIPYSNKNDATINKPQELVLHLPFPTAKMNESTLNKIHGSLLGLAIGDALGAPVEFRPYEYMKANPVVDLCEGGTWGLKKGQFTDDTTMALCLAISLVVCKDFRPYDQLVRYKWWYEKGYMSSTGECFDIGTGTKNAIQRFEKRQKNWAKDYSMDPTKMDYLTDPKMLKNFDVYCSDDDAAGNGGLMRLAPVPLFFHNDPIKAVEYSGVSAKITHGDPRASDACRYYGALIVAALHGETKQELLDENFYERHQKWFGQKKLHDDVLQIVRGSYRKKIKGYESGIRGKGFVLNSLEAALWAFASDNNSFEVGALAAVNLGDDTDTTAAIYGQLAGAYYGYDQLPVKWRKMIYANKFIHHLSAWITQRGDLWYLRQKESKENESMRMTTENTKL